MNRLPEEVLNVWTAHEGPIVFSTVSADGMPNSIYATCVGMSEDGCIVIADNYFKKTKENVLAGSLASVLFISPEGTSCQVKGKVEHHVEGPYFEFMKSWNPQKHPGHAAAVLRPDSCFMGSRQVW